MNLRLRPDPERPEFSLEYGDVEVVGLVNKSWTNRGMIGSAAQMMTMVISAIL